MALSRAGGRSGGYHEINMTPLVDVMLVLLVVFMVTAPLMTTSLRVDLPEVKTTSTPVKDGRLVVSVASDGRIFFGERDSSADVEEVLKGNARVQAEHELYIRADKEARYRAVARAIAAARAAGVTSLNLLVEPEAP